MQNIAKGIHANYPEAVLWLLLVDERPEEVTDMKRNVPGTVFASSNDNTIDKHLDLCQLVIERAKRLVEYGKDVVVLLDSLTRVGGRSTPAATAAGAPCPAGWTTGRWRSPRRLFGAARKIENGGSLTIMATCLIDTGSRMDQVIFEEFKGTGNMELTLDRRWPSSGSSPPWTSPAAGRGRREADGRADAGRRPEHPPAPDEHAPPQAMKSLMDALAKQPTNQGMFSSIRV
jgi:transcription termination factor Rho